MQAPATLSLHFRLHRDLTRLAIKRQDPPWRVIRAFSCANGEALIHLHNLSGGIFGGDNLLLNLDVNASARVQVTTAGATRLYRKRAGREPAYQQTNVSINEDSLLEYVPDQVIPYSSSSYRQITNIHLHGANSGLFWWDTLTPGRIASGERFAYESFGTLNAIYVDGRPIAIERFLIEPGKRQVTSPVRLSHFGTMTTFFICKSSVADSHWLELEAQLEDLAEAQSNGVQWGVSRLVRDGIIIRGLAERYSDLYPMLVQFWGLAKFSLYGQRAIPPRKIY